MLSAELFKLADRHAFWLSVRQRTIAENVAHANTPDFAARSVSKFEPRFDRAGVQLQQTNDQHMRSSTRAGPDGVSYRISADPEGRPVRLENEMMSALEVRRGYELNTSIIKAFNRMILTAAKG